MLISNLTYFWFVVAIIFLFAELNTPGLFFFVSFSIGSLVAAIVAYLGYSLVAQCLIALAVSVVTFLLIRKFLKHKKMSEVLYGSAETNIDALAGAKGIVVTEITQHKKGRVRIGGEVWRASITSKSDSIVTKITSGTIVSVLRVEGNTVIVAKHTEQKDDSSK